MLKSVAYYLRLISVVLFVIFVCLLLNVVFNCGIFGISFLVMCGLFVLINIFTVLSRKDIYKELVSYNLISFALTFYLGIIVVKLYTDYRTHSTMYMINYDYFKTNFIIIDLVILGIILNTLFIYFWDIKKED
ncbi:MAG TPA: hypothetical protein IAB59_03020 [Candidatus Onthousia faecipullorum]|uniref:Uncharacterized protein n=1 Tax=Candidatus Onthousia faecipullorum TaxID=2840887 RepID=A0A9D1KCK1_9FIRM|nr:hypothetical protein [Candidatus Onthousia faecipullorum]